VWIDDYHDNFVRADTMEELDELVAPLFLYKKKDERWLKMYNNIKKCIEMFGINNVSFYHNDYMKYGDHLEEFLNGFWVNLREAEYNDGYIDFENHSMVIENGFLFITH